MSTSTDLAVYEKVADPLAYIKEVGAIIAKAKFWKCDNIEQGQALALISYTENLPMLEMRRRYHVMGGELAMRADYMRAEFRRQGGTYKWINLGDDGQCATAQWVFRENDLVVSYSIEDAKREGLVKAGSRWEKAPGDMLRARCTTKAIRLIASEVLAGFASDEEMEDAAPATNGHSNGHAKTATKKTAAATTTTAPDPNADAIEVPFEVNIAPGQPVTTSESKPPKMADPAVKMRINVLLQELEITDPGWDVEMLSDDAGKKTLAQRAAARLKRLKEGTSQPPAATVAPAGDACTAEQANRVKELWGLLSATPEQREKMLAARGAKTARNLTATQAAELISKLEAKLDSIQPGASPAEPCGQEMAARIKTRLAEVEQTAPGTVAKFRQMMARGGVPKIENLSGKDAGVLLDALTGNGMEAFFGMTVAQWPTPVDPATQNLDAASKN